jgi:hypothetical protein
MPARDMSKYLRDAVLILGITLAMIATLEFGLRVAFPEKIPGKTDLVPHDRYLVALDPGFEGTYKRAKADGGQSITYRINRFGFRGSAIPESTQPDIMVFGDSNVQAVFSPEQSTFVVQLRDRLSKIKGAPLFAINAGVKGFGPDQILVRMRDELKTWHAKLIVVVLYADNDYGDFLRNRMFRLDDAEHLVPYESVADSDLLQNFRNQLRTFMDQFVLGKALNRLYEKLAGPPSNNDAHTYIPYMLHLCQAEYRNYINPEGHRWSGDHYDFDVALNPEIESSITKRRLMAATIGEIAALVEKQTSTYLLFLVLPSRIDASTNSPINYTVLQQTSTQYRRDNLSHPIVETLEKDKLHYIDLTAHFMTEGKSPYYWLANDHWSDAGEALAAELATRYVVEHRLAPLSKP